MSDMPPGSSEAPRKWTRLEAAQRRVLGVLIEKAKTTPAGYPMTVNVIVTASNQKSNREPQMTLEAFYVEKALSELVEMKAVSEIDWMGRAVKYKHLAHEWLGVSTVECAVMAELLLRGAQALGELRARAARMEPIADLGALKPVVEALVERGLMVELTSPGRGQLVTHNLYLEPELGELKARYTGGGARPSAATGGASSGHGVPVDAGGGLAAQVAELRAEVAGLRERVAELEAQLEMDSGGPASG
jgi:uncharacterized protein YceH (UPF0502 family)